MRPALLMVLAFLATGVAQAHAAPAGSTLLVSRPDGFGPPPVALESVSHAPTSVSADGRYVAFASDSDGIAAGTDPTVSNVFVRDTQAGTTTLVSRSDGVGGAGGDGDSSTPAIAVAPDGDVFVAFLSRATNLVDHATGMPTTSLFQQVWLRNVTDGITTLISRAGPGSGAVASAGVSEPSLEVTAGGPVVAFNAGNSNNLGAARGLFLRTVDAGTTQLISCASANCAGGVGAFAQHPALRTVPSVAGTRCAPPTHTTPCVLVAFDTADMSITGDPAQQRQVVVAVATAPASPGAAPGAFGEFSTVSRQNLTTVGNDTSSNPSLSGDGKAVAFVSAATNLTLDALPPDPQQAYAALIPAGQLPQTLLMSKSTGGAGAAADEQVLSAAIGGVVNNGVRLRVGFTTSATNLGGTSRQVYVRDVFDATTSLVNRAAGAGGAPSPSFSDGPALSADGSAVTFASTSATLGDGDTEGRLTRIRLRRIASQTLELVSRPDGTGPLPRFTGFSGVSSASGSVSADGRYVVFTSGSPTLFDGDDDRFSNVFVRDVSAGRTELVSRASGPGGAAANANSSATGISADGRRVAFQSEATNLTPEPTNGVLQVYVRDLDAQTTTLVSRGNGPTGATATQTAGGGGISADGRVVVFSSLSALDPAGGDGAQHIYARDLVTGLTTLVDRDDGPGGAVFPVAAQSPVVSGDGNRVAWESAATMAGAPPGAVRHIFVRDLAARTTTLASRADGVNGASADGSSRFATIDGDGDVVAFTTDADNFGETFVNSQVAVRNLTTGRTQIVSRRTGAAGQLAASVAFPSIDASGDRVVFGAFGLEDPFIGVINEIYMRELSSQTTTLVSRANGVDGAPADGDASFASISPNGDCVAFSARAGNLGDGPVSPDFSSVHLRVLRNECAAALPAGAGPGPAAPSAAAPKPVLSALRMSPRRFRTGGRKPGTTITFRLSLAARVTLRFDRLVAGHRQGKHCRAGARKRGKRCSIARRRGSIAVAGRRGANRRRFSGKLGGRALAPGSYRLTATPRGGKARTLTFTVLPRRR